MNSATTLWLSGLLASSTLLLAGCNLAGSPGSRQEAASNPVNPLEVKLTQALRAQLKVGEPQWSEVSASLRVPGRVEADETLVARVHSPVTGRIAELEVIEGQAVKRGQLLAVLHSTELSDSQFGYLKAFSQRQLAQRAAARARQLLQAGVIGEAELQRRDSEFSQAAAAVATWRDQLKVLGMTDESVAKLESTQQVNSLYHLVASIDGTVLERRVTVGQVLQPADTAFVVADLSRVWLVADVPEQVSGNIAVGKAVQAEIPALPDLSVRGVVSFVSATVNPETRTVRARMNLPNPNSRYKPAMLAVMLLQDRPVKEKVIPLGAVVREGNVDHVFVQTSRDSFVLRAVSLGAEFGDRRVLSGGIREGEKLVLDAAFHVNNERKRLALQGD